VAERVWTRPLEPRPFIAPRKRAPRPANAEHDTEHRSKRYSYRGTRILKKRELDFRVNAPKRQRRRDKTVQGAFKTASNPYKPGDACFAKRLEEKRSIPVGNWLLMDLCAGPSQVPTTIARNGYGGRITAVAVDYDPHTFPDILTDITDENPWRIKLQNLHTFRTTHSKNRVMLETHLTAGPDCDSHCGRAKDLHRGPLINGKRDGRLRSPRAKAQDLCGEMLAYQAYQILSSNRITTTVSFEQPVGGDMFKMQCWKRLTQPQNGKEALLKRARIDLCAYGNTGQKPIDWWCSKEMSLNWVRRCRHMEHDQTVTTPVGACGAIKAKGGSRKHKGRTSGHTMRDARMPDSLCHDMIRDWKLHHDTARAALTGKARLDYGSITLKHARELANQWDRWAATRSNRKRSI
jgi:hypothetical protein